MAITGSPDIFTSEEDLSSYVESSAVTTAAMVGDFEWGPVELVTDVTSETRLIQKFGYPVDRNYKDWFTARNYLAYSSSLKVVRVIGEGSKNATELGDADVFIKNKDLFDFDYVSIAETKAKYIARFPGEYGNKIRVTVLNKAGKIAQDEALAKDPEAKQNPITPYIAKVMQDDDIAIGVWVDGKIKEYGIYSITKGSTDTSGYENYIFNFFNNNSQYIYLMKENFNLTGVIDDDYTLSGGVSDEITNAEYENGWKLFRNEDSTSVSLLMQAGADTYIGRYMVESIAEKRKDCIALLSPRLEECVKNPDPVTAITEGSSAVYPNNSSYAFMDGNYKYQYDQYNDVYRWVPLNGDIAGLMALTDFEERPWFSPAGKAIKDCVKLAFYPSKAERDILFSHNVNPVTNFKEEGNVLWGDWTRVNNTSFNFVSVRRCFLYMERGIKDYARKIMWKPNDALTETVFVQTVEPFIQDVMGGRGISEYKILTGNSVSSTEERDKGIFKAKIKVKPIRSIRWVSLVFTAVRSDISIDEEYE